MIGDGVDVIDIPTIRLEWSPWFQWQDLVTDARGTNGIRVPNKIPGVYEVRRIASDIRLTIGSASDLRFRVKQGLVRGRTAHSSGIRIRANEDVSQLVVRWACTDWPKASEEALHKRHRDEFGRLPIYTAVT